jgi:DNA-binding MarR family transcriptional regulator
MTARPQRLTYLVKQLQEALRARLDDITRPLDLTPKQYTALGVLAESPRISSAELGRITFVSAQAANEMVMTLERKRLVVRAPDPDDRRMIALVLTHDGSSVLAECNRRVARLERAVLRDLTPSQVADFRKALETCLATLTARDT